MNNKNRKYVRPSKKRTSSTYTENNDTEFTLSTTAAISIIAGTFLVGVAAGKIIDMCRKW